jgi:Cu/Ag efflux pump CusA
VQPMAVVIVGGLIAATLFTLFILPALYLLMGAKAQRNTDLGLVGA